MRKRNSNPHSVAHELIYVYRARTQRTSSLETASSTNIRGAQRTLQHYCNIAHVFICWQEWKDATRPLDEFLGFDEWKAIDEDPFYDWRLVRKVLKSLRALRKKDDIRGLLGVLETCLRTNFAGVESARYDVLLVCAKEIV